MKNRIINLVLWIAYLLAMLASLTHVAATFNTLETPGFHFNGWLAAIAVDLGLAALAYAIQQRKRARRSVRSLWLGIVLFADISAYANILHALSVAPLAVAQAVVFSGALPVLVIYLGGIVSSDDAAQADAVEREQRRLEREAERKATLASEQSAQATPLNVAAETPNDAPATQSVFICEKCDATFVNRFALSAHQRSHKNGHVAASEPGEKVSAR